MNITVLIPTSPIPSHPSTVILDETISNIRQYTNAQIVIMFDGVHHSMEHRKVEYDSYKRSVLHKIAANIYGDCLPLIFPHHTHQAEMTRVALHSFVKTPLILFCEHDASPINEIPFLQLCDFVEHSAEINYIRFNIFEQIPKEHYYLMLDKSPRVINGIPLTRTLQWSQRPHIAKTWWYRDLLLRYFKPSEKTMIEDVMHSVVVCKNTEYGEDIFGLAIYTPEGNQLRSYHADGRGDDEKIITG